MKKLICLILTVLLLAGCRQEAAEEFVQPVEFYYCGVSGEFSNSAVMPETRDLGRRDLSLASILALYLQGPAGEGLRSPFPEGTEVEQAEMKNGVLYLTLNDAYASLSGVSLTLANACVVYTMTQFPEVTGVYLQTTGSMLSDQMSKVLTRSDFLVEDNTAAGDIMTLRVYFMDESGRRLAEETRTAALDSMEEIAVYLLQQLLLGPEADGLQPVLPENTSLLDVRIAGTTCSVDFSKEFLSGSPDDPIEARLTVLSVVNTLTQLQQVEYVRIFCEGQSVEEGYYLDLTRQLRRDETALTDDRGGETLDADLYVTLEEGELLIPVPAQVTLLPDDPAAVLVLEALCDFEAANGYENPIPRGTKVLSLNVEDGLCRLELNSAFALCDRDPRQAKLAIRALTATLCALEDIDRVQISVRHSVMTQVDLSEPLTAEEAWIVS